MAKNHRNRKTVPRLSRRGPARLKEGASGPGVFPAGGEGAAPSPSDFGVFFAMEARCLRRTAVGRGRAGSPRAPAPRIAPPVGWEGPCAAPGQGVRPRPGGHGFVSILASYRLTETHRCGSTKSRLRNDFSIRSNFATWYFSENAPPGNRKIVLNRDFVLVVSPTAAIRISIEVDFSFGGHSSIVIFYCQTKHGAIRRDRNPQALDPRIDANEPLISKQLPATSVRRSNLRRTRFIGKQPYRLRTQPSQGFPIALPLSEKPA